MQASTIVAGDNIIGLSAQNPKGHAACIIAAARALKSAEIPLVHDLLLGFGAGGMPSNARPSTRIDSGHGIGLERMLRERIKAGGSRTARSSPLSFLLEMPVEDRVPEFFVGTRELRGRHIVNGRSLGVDSLGNQLNLYFVVLARRHAHGSRLQQSPNGDDLFQFIDARSRHDIAAPFARPQHTLFPKLHQSLANRCARNAQPLRQPLFGDPLARGESPPLQGIDHDLTHLLAQHC
jgi:hypothetical protein